MTRMSRRGLITSAAALAAGALLRPTVTAAAPATRISADPFKLLGLASGDPLPDGVVLWTRLALDLGDTDTWGLSEPAYQVGWSVRDAEAPGRPEVRSGTAIATRDKGYAVHVEASGLKPGRRYDYRFTMGDHGIEGRTRTAPTGSPAEAVRFTVCSCAEYENELYYAYKMMADEQPDFILHLGDYIYERTYRQLRGPGNSRRELRFDADEPLTTLAQYRRRYAEHKAESDGWLKAAHAAAPFITTWDDHEVANDYSGLRSEMRDERNFFARRAAAYRAYFENMPLRLSWLPRADGGRLLYRQFGFGDLLQLYVLDTRQHRSPQACPWGSKQGGKLVSALDCPDVVSPRRTMLGRAQRDWLARSMERSRARWNMLAQGVPFAILDAQKSSNTLARAIGSKRDVAHVWTDSWAGFQADQEWVVSQLERHRQKNPVVLSGDIHTHFVNRIRRDWTKGEASPVIAPELITAAISSNLRDMSKLAEDNKATVVYQGGQQHGYILCELTRQSLDATMVTVQDKDPAKRTARADRSVRFRVTAGDPEPRRV